MSIPTALSIACAAGAVLMPIGTVIFAWTTRTGETRLARTADFAVPALLMLPVGAFLGFMIPIALYGLGRVILAMLGVSP